MATEDFTTYTAVDPLSHLTITAGKIDANGITRDEDTRVYADKGADHFGATWDHDVEVTIVTPAGTSSLCATWAVGNVVDDVQHWRNNNSQALFCGIQSGKFYLWNTESGAYDSGVVNNNQKYYLTVERTSETAIQIRIYSDAARTVLVDTLAETITSDRRYRYVFGINSTDSNQSGSAYDISTDVENLDLNEAAPSAGNPWWYYQHAMLGAA